MAVGLVYSGRYDIMYNTKFTQIQAGRQNMLTKEQLCEVEKYKRAYKDGNYKLSRMMEGIIRSLFDSIIDRNSLLDISAGRGEIIYMACEAGFYPVMGTELVDYLINNTIVYGPPWDLPFQDREFDMLTIFDVMEHLLPDDSVPTIKEVSRVAQTKIAVHISSRPNFNGPDDLHINVKTFAEWDKLLKKHMPDWDVQMKKEFSTETSKCWICRK